MDKNHIRNLKRVGNLQHKNIVTSWEIIPMPLYIEKVQKITDIF